MKLWKYLYGAYAGLYTNGFPGELEIPQDFAAKLAQLYKFGELNAREYGCRVEMQPNTTPDPPVRLVQPDLVSGTRNGCDIRRTTFPGECGDAHSHPSTSIGHVKGYSAPSMQDYLVFQYHLNKPVFIRFVASGPWLYAAVYRHGLTQFDPNDIADRVQDDDDAMWAEFAQRNGTTRQAIQQKLADDQLHHNIDPTRQLLDMKRQTRGFGKWLMKASVTNNTNLASRESYGFYSSQGNTALVLQAGPRV
jgi:hypothetical protein